MINEATGNLLQAHADALVNTVNTAGVMGKGIALQFKRAFPENYRLYRAACLRDEVKLGSMFVTATGQLEPHYIVNFPTKGHWKSRSRIDDIRRGLQDLLRVIDEIGIKSIAVPPLGCGNGGLRWVDVEPVIREAFASHPHVNVELFAPDGAPSAASMPIATRRPAMTVGRAALLALLDRYRQRANQEQLTDAAGVSELELQKLMYFLQVAGQPLRLGFARGRYGPYSDALSHVLDQMEGHYSVGFGDRTSKVLELTPIVPTGGSVAAAEQLVARSDGGLGARVNRVMDLIEGFASPYGLELLTSVHYVASGAKDASEATRAIADWNPRKGRIFTPDHVERAWARLLDHGWLAAAGP